MTDEFRSVPKRVLSPQERRQRNREEMIGAILEAAREVMREEGVAALNLQEVARRVGMRAPSLYTYFASKIGIYEALFAWGMRVYREQLEKVIQTYGATWEGLEAGLTNSMQFAQIYPEMHQLLFERPVPGFVPSEAGMQEAGRLVEMTQQAFRDMAAAGLIAATVSVEDTANLYIAVMQGLTTMHVSNEPHVPIEEGRFGRLIPNAMAMLRSTLGTQRPAP